MIAINVVGLVGTMLAARRVGRMVDRLGVKKMLLLGHFFWSFLPAIWLLATPRTAVLWIGFASLVGGVFPAAANNAGVKLVTRFASPEESGMYMAVSAMIGSFAVGLGSVVSGGFLSLVGGWSFTVLGLVVSAFPLLFVVSFLLRLASTFALVPKIRVKGTVPDEERPFLLPLFFESVPGISRLVRSQRRGGREAGRGPSAP
jgi:MFS family permease